jgi:[protein-PII] uridylyltransferase
VLTPTASLTFKQTKASLLAAWSKPGHIQAARQVYRHIKQLSDLADRTIKELWQKAEINQSFSLIAVGGYGREELFPFSDIDVLILLPENFDLQAHSDAKAKVEAFIGTCWDTGLEIGSSVRTLGECIDESVRDVTIQTALIESRLLVGSKDLYKEFQREFKSHLDPVAFYNSKLFEMQQRHNKFQNTPYALEPNCKESPGGLRDLQLIKWLTNASGLSRSWDDLVEAKIATALEVRQIKRNESLLFLIRFRLHLAANRREDRLVFDLQSRVAQDLSLGESANRSKKISSTLPSSKSRAFPALPASPTSGSSATSATFGSSPSQGASIAREISEALMKRYYWCAKAVTQLNQILLLNIEELIFKSQNSFEPKPIDEYFADKAGMLEVRQEDIYERDSSQILRTFLVYQQTPGIKGLSAKTLRSLFNARAMMDSKFRHDPKNRATFMKILSEPNGITHSMRLMNQNSVLGRYLWAFRKIVGQMQHDLFHVYTVDQHILMVLRNVRRFFIPEHAHEYPLCSQLASGIEKPWVLFVAALFHDIAKGRGGDHSVLGAADAKHFCKAHNISAEDTQLIVFLVNEHLTMSQIAQKSDLSDPVVIQEFSRKVGNERYLTALYLLTVADIRGTSPKVWNAWKGKLLEDLYKITLRSLGGRAPDPHAEIESSKREALYMLSLYALPEQSHLELWETLDVSYFMRHEASEIAWHTRQIYRATSGAKIRSSPPGVTVRARLSPLGEGLQVMVYTPDQADLFARICGFFDQAQFSILDAKIHTAKNGYALDTFQVVTSDSATHYRDLVASVETGLSLTIESAQELPQPSLGRISRRVKNFPVTPRVTLLPDERAQHWVLSVSASDKAGLLYKIARILAKHDINLKLAKITTLGERVEDVFLIDGSALQQNKSQIEIESELLEAASA